MASHNELGKDGEEMAARWLKENGFDLVHRNWRHSHYEIDIVATRGAFLHFIEVKARRASPVGGYPEESVSKKKFQHLLKAADQYLFLNPGHQWIQYDILAITLLGNGEAEYFFIEDVFL